MSNQRIGIANIALLLSVMRDNQSKWKHSQLIKLNSMTDKEKFRKEVEKLKSNLIYGACSSQIAMETMCKEEAYNEVLAILDTMQEEPVSEELEKASYCFACKCHPLKTEYSTSSPNPEVIEAFKAGAKWQNEQMMVKAINGTARPDDNEIWCELTSSNFKDGDKVKVILIKED